MDKKAKKRLTTLQQKLQREKQRLACVKKQCDDPAELAQLEKTIADVETEIAEIKEKG